MNRYQRSSTQPPGAISQLDLDSLGADLLRSVAPTRRRFGRCTSRRRNARRRRRRWQSVSTGRSWENLPSTPVDRTRGCPPHERGSPISVCSRRDRRVGTLLPPGLTVRSGRIPSSATVSRIWSSGWTAPEHFRTHTRGGGLPRSSTFESSVRPSVSSGHVRK